VLFLATSWESLASWGIPFSLAFEGIESLAWVQRFAQGCTALIANLGLALLVAELVQRLTRSDRAAWTAAFTALSVPHLRWTANLAKHDLGVGFWFISLPIFSWTVN
jgi:hypothetical protein